MTSLKIRLQENEVERQQRWNDKDNGNGIDMPEKHLKREKMEPVKSERPGKKTS